MSIPLNMIATVDAGDPAIAGWRVYPDGIDDQNTITTSTKITASMQSLSGQLSGLKKVLFSDDIDLQVIDIRESGGALHKSPLLGLQESTDLVAYQILGRTTCDCKTYEEEADVEKFLLQPDSKLPKVRIMYGWISSFAIWGINECKIVPLREIATANRHYRIADAEDFDKIQSRSSVSTRFVFFRG